MPGLTTAQVSWFAGCGFTERADTLLLQVTELSAVNVYVLPPGQSMTASLPDCMMTQRHTSPRPPFSSRSRGSSTAGEE